MYAFLSRCKSGEKKLSNKILFSLSQYVKILLQLRIHNYELR
ncbi:hypothetical protein IQ02_02907, partial [Flavobacterium glaciei]